MNFAFGNNFNNNGILAVCMGDFSNNRDEIILFENLPFLIYFYYIGIVI